ncbi:MAG TPA: aldehyde dehydrogenase family protein, partial [Candidatus Angelobacter sp.]
MNAITTELRANTIAVRNPATDEVIGEVPCCGAEEVAAAVKRAASAQKRWAASPISKRLELLRKFQQLLCEQRDSVAAVITREAGKPLPEATATEVLVVLEAANFLIANVPAFLQP